MGPTASDVIALAQNTKALSKEQLARILELAPNSSSEDLEELKKLILEIQKAHMFGMKHELDVRQKAGAAYKEWQADKSRDALQTQEGAVSKEDHAQAETLIQNI